MGCRPSRRAAVCVRVANDGPWGVRRSSRSVGAAGGVQLRERSTRVGHGGRVGANPQDRYSAPPADTHFPAHSCTTATYNHGCCGRSRITLRLSKNGSTLEIETTEFQDGDRTCQNCSVDDCDAAGSYDDTVLLRTQSAPNLTTFTRDDHWYCPIPSSPVPRRRLLGHRVGSGTGSVRTATAVEVDVEDRRGERKPSITSAASSAVTSTPKVDVPVHVLDANQVANGGECSNNKCVVLENQGACNSSAVCSITSDTTNKSVIHANSLETADLSSHNKDIENLMKAESLAQMDGVRTKAKTDSPRVFLKAGCHKSNDSLKKLWCHTVGDVGRVAAAAASAKWERQSDESTDTGCESDEEDKLRLLSRLEMGPTYVHTDFKNDFEDLFDDTSPELEES